MRRKKYLEYRGEDGMLGPFWFELDSVEAIDGRARGVYLLTHEARGLDPRLVVVYVGRGRIRDRLGAHLDDEEKSALHFFFKPLLTEEEAFEEECRLFHAYGRSRHLDNKIHPAVPSMRDKYPRCSTRRWDDSLAP
jgi:hypothetical protein